MEDRTKSAIIASIVRLADLWCEATGDSRAALSRKLFNRGGQLEALDAGERDLNTRSAEAAMSWFSTHWPESVDWPADVSRPLTAALFDAIFDPQPEAAE